MENHTFFEKYIRNFYIGNIQYYNNNSVCFLRINNIKDNICRKENSSLNHKTTTPLSHGKISISIFIKLLF